MKSHEIDLMFGRVDALRRVARINREQCTRFDALADAARREAYRLEEEAAKLWDEAYALKYPKDGLLVGLRRIR